MIDDGFVLMYVKDNELYPVAISSDQLEALRFLVPAMIPGTISIVMDKPQGKAINLVKEKGC